MISRQMLLGRQVLRNVCIFNPWCTYTARVTAYNCPMCVCVCVYLLTTIFALQAMMRLMNDIKSVSSASV